MNEPGKKRVTRPAPSGPQMWRILQLLSFLRSGQRFTTRSVAEKFEVSRRTIHSDIEWLRTFGAPISFDQGRNTYVLTEPFEEFPLLSVRRGEWAALLVAQHALQALGDTPHAQLLEHAVARLAEHLPETIRVEPEVLARTIRFEAGPHPPVPFFGLEMLEKAISEQRVVRMRYYSNSKAEEVVREVESHTLLSYQHRWYLIAWCRLRQAMRDFRVDRIRQMEVLDEVFAIPPEFNLDTYLGPAFGMYRGDRTYAVHVRFSPYQARWISEEYWHASQVMILRPDGWLDVMMQVTGLADVARWVLSYGAECEVISPPILRHRVAGEARRMTGIYSESSEDRQHKEQQT